MKPTNLVAAPARCRSRTNNFVLGLLAAVSATLGACNNANLVGDSNRVGVKAPVSAGPTAPSPATPPPASGPTPPPVASNPGSPNEPASPPIATTPDNPTTPTPTPTTPPQSNPPTVDSESDSRPSIGSIVQLIGGLIKTLSNVEVDNSSANQVIFGPSRTFHIGDGEFNSQSDCARQVRTYSLKGSRYFFEFAVTADDTTVDVSIGKICGVDYNTTNVIYLKSGNTVLDQKPLAAGQSSATFNTQKLAVGTYTIMVESHAAASENAENPDDHDDYIVGRVTINGDKPVRPGKVGTLP